jgi:thiamine biosynthesis lipoprotein
MRRYRYLPPVLVICAILGLTIVRSLKTRNQQYTDSRIVLGTLVEISVWGTGEVSARAAVDSAFREIAEVESLFGDGMVIGLKDAGVVASDEFNHLMDTSQQAYLMAGGFFDPTIGSVSRLWQFGEGAVPPPEDSIALALSSVGLDHYLETGSSQHVVFDVGGVAKGYAVDRAAGKLRALGFRSAIINAGGDLGLIGKRVDGEPWKIAIRHPRQAGTFIACLDLEDISVATSGDYEKFFLSGGKRFHHILDPHTGRPGSRSTGVTVVTPNACLGDALATGLFLLGHEQGIPVVEAADGIDAVFVYSNGESLAVSSGLAGKFRRYESE